MGKRFNTLGWSALAFVWTFDIVGWYSESEVGKRNRLAILGPTLRFNGWPRWKLALPKKLPVLVLFAHSLFRLQLHISAMSSSKHLETSWCFEFGYCESHWPLFSSIQTWELHVWWVSNLPSTLLAISLFWNTPSSNTSSSYYSTDNYFAIPLLNHIHL